MVLFITFDAWKLSYYYYYNCMPEYMEQTHTSSHTYLLNYAYPTIPKHLYFIKQGTTLN